MPQRLLIHGISYKTGDVEQGSAPCYIFEFRGKTEREFAGR